MDRTRSKTWVTSCLYPRFSGMFAARLILSLLQDDSWCRLVYFSGDGLDATVDVRSEWQHSVSLPSQSVCNHKKIEKQLIMAAANITAAVNTNQNPRDCNVSAQVCSGQPRPLRCTLRTTCMTCSLVGTCSSCAMLVSPYNTGCGLSTSSYRFQHYPAISANHGIIDFFRNRVAHKAFGLIHIPSTRAV